MSEWKPIETAPRDGTAFLGYSPKYGWVGTVRYDLVDDDEPEIGNPNWEFLGSTVTCTHWMPLPEAPQPERFDDYGHYGENNPPVGERNGN